MNKHSNTFHVLIAALMVAISTLIVPATAYADPDAGVADAGTPMNIDLPKDELLECQAEKEKLATEKKVTEAELAALKKICPPGVLPTTTTPPSGKKAGGSTGPKSPWCSEEGGAVLNKATNGCECPDLDLKIDWPGRKPGVPVRIQRKLQPAVTKSGQPIIECVALQSSLDSAVVYIDGRIKQLCDVDPTEKALGAPNPSRADLYTEGGAFKECGKLRAYLHEVVEWQRAFKGLKGADGSPADLSPVNWLIVWNRILAIQQTLENHEGRIKKLEDTACQKNADGTFNENCPKPSNSKSVGFSGDIGVCANGTLRPGTDSLALGAHAALNFWGSPRVGATLYGCGGWSFNRDVPRYHGSLTFGALFALTEDRDVSLSIGPSIFAEPILNGWNDALGFGGRANLPIEVVDWFVFKPELFLGVDTHAQYRELANGQVEWTRSPFGFVGQVGAAAAFRFGD